MNIFFKALLIGLGFLSSCFIVAAQESGADTLKYKLGIDFSGARSSGVFSRTTFRAGANFTLTQNRWEFQNDASYQFNNTNGIKLLDNWMNVASLQYHLESVWKWFPVALYQFETNYIYQVKNRHRFGLGIGAYPIDKNGYLLRFTAGLFHENELYNFNKFVNSNLENPKRQHNSAWLHLTNKIPIGKTKGVLEIDFWYFQSFKEGSDYSLSILPKLKIKINKNLSFHILIRI